MGWWIWYAKKSLQKKYFPSIILRLAWRGVVYFCWERKECLNLQWCHFIPAWCTCSGYAFSSVETTPWPNCFF
jgi:hypothetical protein